MAVARISFLPHVQVYAHTTVDLQIGVCDLEYIVHILLVFWNMFHGVDSIPDVCLRRTIAI